jgi:hypothetical protein
MPFGSKQLLCPQMLVATAELDKGPSLGKDLGKPTERVRGVKGTRVHQLASSATN